MIGLKAGDIAVDPIFDKSVTEAHNALTREEKEYLDSQGIEYSNETESFKIPESAIKKCDQGTIKYLGRGVEEKFDLHIGQWVLFSGYTGTTIRLSDEGIVIVMAATHVHAIVEPPATPIPGLYFFDGQEYVTATHELAVDLICREFEELQLIKTRPVKNG